MEIKISKSDKDSQERKVSQESTKMGTFSSEKAANDKKVLVLKAKKSKSTENCTHGPFLPYMQTLDRRVPKHIITLDEKFLRRSLELVYASAMRGASYTSVLESSPFQISTFSLNFKSDMNEFVNSIPIEAGTGTITRGKSGINLLKSPLFRQSRRAYLGDATKSDFDNVSTSSQLSINSFPNRETKSDAFECERFNLENEHKRQVSVSNSYNLSTRLSFSLFGNLNKGMLCVTWKCGLPRYVFSLDDRNEIYLANIIKSETPDEYGFDYMYTFCTNEANLLGKMRVSKSFKLCSNNSEIKETEFVLFGKEERDSVEVQASTSQNYKKNKGLSRKMFSKERAYSKSVSINENRFMDLSDFSPNLELAAIIVKDHVCANRQEPNMGGWGMKFLKKNEPKKTKSCDYFENNGKFSTNIIIPADFHGGPRDGVCGPSSLIDRWRCGGKCDCGGWDLGCPITLLSSERNRDGNLSQSDIRVSGLEDSNPVMKMVNIRDGLYVIHFGSNLSTLQCLSIAISIIHTQSLE